MKGRSLGGHTFWVLWIYAFASNIYASAPTVQTQFGTLRGLLSDAFSAIDDEHAEIYLNIPYAKPPVDELRFQKPQAYEAKWSGERDATRFGFDCVPLIAAPEAHIGEDCLTLNIFRPQKRRQELLPALVYHHGGGFGFGAASAYGYQQLADNLVRHGLIVVTLQYRLGVYGFASVGGKDSPSNLGLFDQAAALRWLSENIGAFGGDARRITSWGLSAGAASVALLALSPHSRDLISGATIEMSGAPLGAWALSDETIDYTRALAAHMRCDTSSAAAIWRCLAATPQADILSATTSFVSSHTTTSRVFNVAAALLQTRPTSKLLQFTPRLDGDFFPAPLEQLLRDAPAIPSLIGVTASETHYFTILNKDMSINSIAVPPAQQANYSRKALVAYIDRLFTYLAPNFEQNLDTARRECVDFYTRDEAAQADDRYFYLRRYNELTADWLFNIPSVRWSQEYARHKRDSYFYVNEHFNKAQFAADVPIQASTHANEYAYLNGLFPIGNFELDDHDRTYRAKLIEVVTAVVNTGKPRANWTALSPSARHYARFARKLSYHDDAPFSEALAAWQRIDALSKHGLFQGLRLSSDRSRQEL